LNQTRTKLALLILTALAVLVGCGSPPENGESRESTPERHAMGKGKGMSKGRRGMPGAGSQVRVPVVAGVVSVGDMEAFLDASSTLEAEETVEVVSQATGVVAEVLAEEGDRFAKGRMLARLAYEELELAERRAQSELERLKADFARAEKLRSEAMIPEEDFQQVSFDLARADLDWQQKKLELQRTMILSPISGTVAGRMIRIGDLVRENEVVFSVVDFDSLVAPVFVPEKYLSDIRTGQKALLRPQALGGREMAGSVLRISPVVDSRSGTVRVVVAPESPAGLRPGMFASVQLVLDRHEGVVVVPRKAILYEDEAPHVFVIAEGRASRRSLELGYEDQENAEVVSGLEAGETVVLIGQSALKEGSMVAAEDESGNPLGKGKPGARAR
jgi:membrane fusion protein (multidrug efflux system)